VLYNTNKYIESSNTVNALVANSTRLVSWDTEVEFTTNAYTSRKVWSMSDAGRGCKKGIGNDICAKLNKYCVFDRFSNFFPPQHFSVFLTLVTPSVRLLLLLSYYSRNAFWLLVRLRAQSPQCAIPEDSVQFLVPRYEHDFS